MKSQPRSASGTGLLLFEPHLNAIPMKNVVAAKLNYHVTIKLAVTNHTNLIPVLRNKRISQ
mgnify:CR=1 FL=1